MKIGIDIRVLSEKRTGKASHLAYLLEGFAANEEKHEFVLYTKKQPPASITLPQNSKVKVISKPGILWHYACWLDATFKERIDTFLATTSYIIPSFSKKCVIVIHDLVALLNIAKHNTKAVMVEKRTLKKAMRNAKKIIAVSNSTKKDIQKMFPKVADKTSVIHEAIDPAFYSDVSEKEKEAVRKKYNLPEKYILFVSTLEARKNIGNLLAANRIVHEQNEGALPLVMAGKIGWGVEDQLSELEDQQQKKWTQHLGHIEYSDLRALYQSATIYLFPSLYEGFGLTVLEAMASKVPVITSITSSLPEIGGKTVIYIDPKSAKEIALAVGNLSINSQLQRDMGENAFKRAQKFSIQTMAEQTMDVIESA